MIYVELTIIVIALGVAMNSRYRYHKKKSVEGEKNNAKATNRT